MKLSDLDFRDVKLLAMVHRGRRDEYIAKELSTTVPRVRRELGALYQRLGLEGRVSAGLWYQQQTEAAHVH